MRPPRLLVASGLAVALVVAALAAGAAPAVANSPSSPILTLGSTGTPASPGDSVGGQMTTGSFQLTIAPVPVPVPVPPPSSPAGLTCAQASWQGQLLNNPVAPGPASIKFVSAFKFTGCTDNVNPTITGFNGGGMSGLPAPLLVGSGTTYPLQILPFNSPLQIVVNLATQSGAMTCVYQTNVVVNGSTTVGSSPWAFVNQPFNLVSGAPALCSPTGVVFLTVAYNLVYDATANNTLTVN
ncbi:MAG TPA: hypothetical protein VGX23_02795 [Actinocrinis sp.]|nr:hypothetical protein [Actinocrinis sp.]